MTSKKKRSIALALLLSGFLLLPMVLAGYAISHFIIVAQLVGDGSSTGALGGMFSNLILGVMGIVGVLSFFIGIPVGLVMFVHANKDLARELRTEEPFRSMPEDQFQFIMKPSWGAFFNAPAWAFCNKLYGWGVVALFIPIANLYAWLRLFADGRRLAWTEPVGWQSFEQFKHRQKIATWVVAGVIILSFIASIVVPALIGRLIATRLSQGTLDVGFSQDDGPQTAKELDDKIASMHAFVCARLLDTDGDGLDDGFEAMIDTNKEAIDTDGDGYSDYEEVMHGYDPLPAETSQKDTDGDGLPDVIERYIWQSDVRNPDTDGDGQNDLAEVQSGTAPKKTGAISLEEFQKELVEQNAKSRAQNECK